MGKAGDEKSGGEGHGFLHGEPGGVTYWDLERGDGGDATGDGGGPLKEHRLQKKRRLLD